MKYRHLVDDELLRFFDHCRSYVEGVENNRSALQEVNKFKHGEEMEALRRRTARRMGLHHQRLTTGQTHKFGASVQRALRLVRRRKDERRVVMACRG